MWTRTINGIIFIPVQQTKQGFWIPKKENNNNNYTYWNDEWNRKD